MQFRSSVVASFLGASLCACAGERSESSGVSPASGTHARSDESGEVVHELSDELWIVFHDSHGAHWFGSDGQGVYRFDGRTLVRYTTKEGLCNDHLRQIQEDGAGNLLFSTNGGIAKFDGRRFSTLVPIESGASGASGTSAGAWKLEPGDLWFTGNSPYRYDGTSLARLEFPKIALEDEYDAKFPRVPWSPYAVYSIHRDRQGALWFGTAVFGVCRYDGRSFAWITEDELTELHNGPSFGVRGIVEDQDGKFWFNDALHRYDAHPKDSPGSSPSAPWYRKERGPAAADATKGPAGIMSALTDRHGDVWMATYGEGVWRYDGQRFSRYPVLVGREQITLFSIYEDRDGVLWLGTQSNGAWRFDGKNFVRFEPRT